MSTELRGPIVRDPIEQPWPDVEIAPYPKRYLLTDAGRADLAEVEASGVEAARACDWCSTTSGGSYEARCSRCKELRGRVCIDCLYFFDAQPCDGCRTPFGPTPELRAALGVPEHQDVLGFFGAVAQAAQAHEHRWSEPYRANNRLGRRSTSLYGVRCLECGHSLVRNGKAVLLRAVEEAAS